MALTEKYGRRMETGGLGQLQVPAVIFNLNLADRFKGVTSRGIRGMTFGTKPRLIVGVKEFVAETDLRTPGTLQQQMATVDSE